MIETKSDWWNEVESNKEDLLSLVANYHPYYRNRYSYPITAKAAEAACELFRKDIQEQTTIPPCYSFEEYIKTKNVSMVDLLNDTWFGMPESMDVRDNPGFGILCDLCSESWVLEENKEGNEEN